MPKKKYKYNPTLGSHVPAALLNRVKLEAVRTGKTIQAVVIDALEAHVPKRMRVVIESDVDVRRRA